MKKISISVLCALIFTFNFTYAQQRAENDPINLVKVAILHAFVLEATKDVRNFTSTLDDPELRYSFTDEVVASGKKKGLNISPIYRGNTIEFSYPLDSMKVKVFVNLDFQENIHGTDVQYFSKSGKLYSGEWFDVPRNRNISLSKVDDVKTFSKYSRIAGQMMKGGLRPQDVLFARLLYNMTYNQSYFDLFQKIMVEQGLKVKGENGEVYVVGDKQSYRLTENGKVEKAVIQKIEPGW